ncbi:DUF397 domain-containing protein [Saccharothrix obliqua]|uniref:DUF397 domain-containing protein n=1 Tax=Saccharothrix obliqua TaxID=2861747 RepID=UPI001C5E25E8|nr:DUF397 domain-containing protein [Saccharothrix obliqua]MBW4716142.1 DUF397 domain-containing protein [Saccharothrix obliqua]
MNTWRKSSYSSSQANCVEVRHVADSIAVRDSKNPHGPVLSVAEVSWRGFVRRIGA